MASSRDGPTSALLLAAAARQRQPVRPASGDFFDVRLRHTLQDHFGAAPKQEDGWDGPSYGHRGARIECRLGGYVCRLVMRGHPLDGQVFGRAGNGVPLIDLWLDEGRLPDGVQAGPAI